MPEPVQVSFVVPARNEAEHIGDCLDSIAAAVAGRWTYERIVVDHGSTDRTAAIAVARGARVLAHPSGTVAAVRNAGVEASSGGILAFIDGDTVLRPGWGDGLENALREFAVEPRTLAGAKPGIADPPSWIERLWFDPAKRTGAHYLPGANLVAPRPFFHELGGFDARLETGEDYDVCRRARLAGGRVLHENGLAVEHRGWPRTLRQFVRREAWHGAGDFATLRDLLASRVALATVLFLLLHIAAVASAPLFPPASLLAVGGVAGLCLAMALAKYRRSPLREIPQLAVLYYAYFSGRSIALFRALRLVPAADSSPRPRAVREPAVR
jgi:glycosyltransferase involved in cell wall biosynthesis